VYSAGERGAIACYDLPNARFQSTGGTLYETAELHPKPSSLRRWAGAAIANALFDAIGARIVRLPMTADRLRMALAKLSPNTTVRCTGRISLRSNAGVAATP
jgi:hypothetical protein